MHTGSITRTRVHRFSAVALGFAAASVLVGCTFSASAGQPTESPEADGQPAAVTAEETCAQLIDVNTVLYNEKIAFDEGRIADVEYGQVQQLVGRMVHRIDVDPDTALAETIATLRIVVGAYAPGGTTFDATTDQWAAVFADARDECTRAGVAFYTEGWTGG
jgi:hypothetical protein